MLIDKKKMVEHLQRVHANGQIGEAVLKGAFGVQAMTADQQLMVLIPELPKVESLGEEVGMVDLGLTIKLINTLSAESGDVNIEFSGGKLNATQKHGGRIKLVTAKPSAIGTKINAETVTSALEYINGNKTEVPLDQTVVSGVVETANLLKAKQVSINVGVEESVVLVGSDVSHTGEFEIKGLKSPTPYTLPLDAKMFIDVLKQITDFTQAYIVVTGPDSVVMVREGEYKYIISPQRSSAATKSE